MSIAIYDYHNGEACKSRALGSRGLIGIEAEINAPYEYLVYDYDDESRELVGSMGDDLECISLSRGLPQCFTVELDGSLGDNGIEVITSPLSMYDHPELFGAFFDWIERYADEPGEDYGLHMHISDLITSPLHLARLIRLCWTMRAFTRTRVMRQDDGTYCSFGAIRYPQTAVHFGKYWSNWKTQRQPEGSLCQPTEKYAAIRLHHQGTVELRFPRSFDNAVLLMRQFVFVLGMIERAKTFRLSTQSIADQVAEGLHIFDTGKRYAKRYGVISDAAARTLFI